MEFWGIEVEAGKPFKCIPENGRLIHISQASLGEVKDVKGAKNVTIRLKVGTKDFVLGHLSAGVMCQLLFDLVFDKDFELSHDWKDGSVYFMGYVADQDDSDDPSDDEHLENLDNGIVKPKTEDVKPKIEDVKPKAEDVKPKAEDVKDTNGSVPDAEASKSATKAEKIKEELSNSDDSEDDVDDDSEDSSDADMAPLDDADNDDEDGSEDFSGDEEDLEEDSSSEEELPITKPSKKRQAAGSAQETVPAGKKAKSFTPYKTDNKKGKNAATPLPSKAAGKTPFAGKSKQSPKSGGQFSGKSGNKSNNSRNGKGGKRGGK